MELEINSYSLKSDADRMLEQLNKVREAINKMNDAISTLSGMWEGNAKNAFIIQYSSDYENMEEVCNIVQNIIAGMNEAAVQYGNCNSEAADIVNALRI